jgi:ribosomal protein L7Ae-like RNA K-turn-binding protein
MKANMSQFLGLAMRAGKIVSGEEAVLMAIRQGKAKAVLLAQDGSNNTRKKILDKAKYYAVPTILVDSRESLGHAIGKKERVVVGICDAGFANKLLGMYNDQ